MIGITKTAFVSVTSVKQISKKTESAIVVVIRKHKKMNEIQSYPCKYNHQICENNHSGDYWEMQEKIDKLERKIEEMKASKKSSDNLIDLLHWL